MSGFTVEKLKESQRKLMFSTPSPSEIRIGSPVMFRKAMKDQGVLIEGREDRMTFEGVPVIFHPNIPEHIAVVVEGGEVTSIINLKGRKGE